MERLIDIAKTTLIVVIVSVFLLFCGDWGVVLYKVANHGNALGTITVHRMVTTSLKNGKYDVYALDPVDQTCVNSIFPHQGYTPCWYLQRHTEQITSY